jgi:hypothetical protein
VLSRDSVADKCPDFVSFLKEYRAGFSIINTKDFYSPAPGCTLRVICENNEPDQNCRRYTVSMSDIRFEIPDTIFSPTEDKGATIITLRKGRPPVISSAIPAWHPLLAGWQP